jgi:hypothetical protein
VRLLPAARFFRAVDEPRRQELDLRLVEAAAERGHLAVAAVRDRRADVFERIGILRRVSAPVVTGALAAGGGLEQLEVRERLSSDAWGSPLVAERSVKSAFVGFGFRF